MVIPMVKQFSSSILLLFFFSNILKEKREKIKIDLKNWEKFWDEMIFEKDELFNLIQ